MFCHRAAVELLDGSRNLGLDAELATAHTPSLGLIDQKFPGRQVELANTADHVLLPGIECFVFPNSLRPG
jgi:hypothetical protein